MVDRGTSDEPRDLRRVGLASMGASIGYALALFAPGSVLARGVFGVVVIVSSSAACFVLPPPTSQEVPERREPARNLMFGEALVIAAVSTVIALAMR